MGIPYKCINEDYKDGKNYCVEYIKLNKTKELFIMDFKDDCIWMSYRYCIGRQTIAAHQHAVNIVKYGLDWIPEDRKEFTAKDIRSIINDKVCWYSNIKKDGYVHNYDVVSCIFKYLYDNKIENPEQYYLTHNWLVNVTTGLVCITGEYTAKVSDFDKTISIFSMLNDYEPWIKLANLLDEQTHIDVKVNYKGEELIIKSFVHYMNYPDGIEKFYIGIDQYKDNPYILSYIAQEYIVE